MTDVELSKYIGGKIKQFRETRGLTQDDLADFLGTTRQSISRYETGERKANQDILFKLAELFKVKLDDFFPTRDFDKPYYALSNKEKLDIGKEVDKLLSGLFSTAEVNFYGEPMTDEDKEKLRIAMQMAMEMNKQQAKKDFTPKKYRN